MPVHFLSPYILDWVSSPTSSLILSTFNVVQCSIRPVSSLCSTRPNHHNLIFLITKLTGSYPSNSPSPELCFLTFIVNQHIYLTTLISVLCCFISRSTSIGQVLRNTLLSRQDSSSIYIICFTTQQQ